jgi:hypothetical protein
MGTASVLKESGCGRKFRLSGPSEAIFSPSTFEGMQVLENHVTYIEPLLECEQHLSELTFAG